MLCGCGGDKIAEENKNLKPVTAKASDLQPAGVGKSAGPSQPKASAPLN